MEPEVLKYFERLEEIVERRFTEVKDKQDNSDRRLGNLEIIAAQQAEQIKYHIKRTDLAEDRTELYRQESAQRAAKIEDDLSAYEKEVNAVLEPIKLHQNTSKTIYAWFVGAIGLIISTLGSVAAWLALKH